MNNYTDIRTIESQFNQSTRASWFWAFLFGPLYFAAHGFWGRAAIVFMLNLIFIGIIVAPFLAYPAWRDRARKEAERTINLNAALAGGRK